jgi:hypothetical protein
LPHDPKTGGDRVFVSGSVEEARRPEISKLGPLPSAYDPSATAAPRNGDIVTPLGVTAM